MILAKNSRASWATQNSSLLACWLACSAKTLRLLICLLFLALYSWTFCTLVMKAPWVKLKGPNKCLTFPKLPGRSDLIFTLIINSLFSFFSLILLGRPRASRQYSFYGLPTVPEVFQAHWHRCPSFLPLFIHVYKHLLSQLPHGT